MSLSGGFRGPVSMPGAPLKEYAPLQAHHQLMTSPGMDHSVQQLMHQRPGHDASVWHPWRSQSALAAEAVQQLGWQERYGVLKQAFQIYGCGERPGTMTLREFCTLLDRHRCVEEAYHEVFFSLFDRDQDGCITEMEFVSGMMASSPAVAHDMPAAITQLRLQLIFLYYDSNRTGLLEMPKLARLLKHLRMIDPKSGGECTSSSEEILTELGGAIGGVLPGGVTVLASKVLGPGSQCG
eukprot:Polyplicarium_translucidae@DN5308_c0_g1_i1.p1